jgi:hypothetical protein
VTAPRRGKPVDIELVRNEPSCRKCRETEAVLAAVERERPGRVTVRVMPLSQAQAAGHGVLLTPTVLVNGKVLCGGIVPRQDGVLRIVDQELAAGG